ncbi:hypothetical protein VPHG_00154 [Vibrio phage 11895-B1]|uniref:hypothetical protein n=1 Tax=Vibrio phage 11895-B1 TaxID=754075 RepID=UPI0002C106F5|nr:hypothetical protein VPHG_00154 [Vibrio phage 11895-B1]AGH32218.1 hypothetical protein VPHG_00154 [Vibrio phage 11895-B1]
MCYDFYTLNEWRNEMNTADKYYWITDHPALNNEWGSVVTIEMTPHMVNPETNMIDTTLELNTKLQWWIEVMVANKNFNPDVVFPHEDSFEHSHDWNLDCGGDTAEEAIDTLYFLVLHNYGDYDEQQV